MQNRVDANLASRHHHSNIATYKISIATNATSSPVSSKSINSPRTRLTFKMVLKSSKWFRNVQNGFEKFKMVLRIRNSFEKTHFKIVLGRNYIGIFLRSAVSLLGSSNLLASKKRNSAEKKAITLSPTSLHSRSMRVFLTLGPVRKLPLLSPRSQTMYSPMATFSPPASARTLEGVPLKAL